MGFDGVLEKFQRLSEPSGELSPRERLEILMRALRGRLPRGFTWDFSTMHRHIAMLDPDEDSGIACGTAGCAIGVAIELGLVEPMPSSPYRPGSSLATETWIEGVMRQFSMEHPTFDSIFMPGGYMDGAGRSCCWLVTPDMVANKIEQYLKSMEG